MVRNKQIATQLPSATLQLIVPNQASGALGAPPMGRDNPDSGVLRRPFNGSSQTPIRERSSLFLCFVTNPDSGAFGAPPIVRHKSGLGRPRRPSNGRTKSRFGALRFVVLSGRAADGSFLTASAKEYGPALCRLLASIANDHFCMREQLGLPSATVSSEDQQQPLNLHAPWDPYTEQLVEIGADYGDKSGMWL